MPTPTMTLFPGQRLGTFEILAALGAGGMGEVYHARDLKLGRDVAIKVLPAAFVTDPERLGRFQREARLLAALNHPHIASVFGLEESGETTFLAMELVEGESLADRVQAGALGLDESLQIARQIGEALAAAHDKGIVHRDLKPANVMVTSDGRVKVLDFGLAKMLEAPGGAISASLSPTLSVQATMAGTILGTAAYMSPEQARGRTVDKRTDIWAFGCVLYEMLTGRRAFEGDDVTDTIAAVVRGEPNWSAIPPETSMRVVDVVRRCLVKDPGRRLADISVPLFLLSEDAPAPPTTPTAEGHVQPPRWKRAAPIAAAVLLTAAVAAGISWMMRPSPPEPPVVTRFTMPLPQGQQFTNTGRQIVDVSRDGSQFVYVANQRLYLRGMGDLEPRLIPGSDLGGNILNPVFSPDGREVAFWYGPDTTIRRLATAGGAAVVVASTPVIFGMRWDEEGLVFGQAAGKEIARVSPSGGTPEVIAKLGEGEFASSPQLLPDGRGVLFSVRKAADAWDKAQIVVQTADGTRKVVVNGGADGRYVASGHLLYAVGGVLMAVPFDLGRLEVTGGAVPVVEGVRRASQAVTGTATAQFSVATNGSLVYVPGPARPAGEAGDRRLAIYDGKGGIEPLNMPLGSYQAPRVSRDGRTVAFESGDDGTVNVWVLGLDGKSAPRRLTFGGQNRAPVWSPDGQWIAFQSDREGDLAIYRQRADGSAAAERLTKPEKGIVHIPQSWSPEGAQLLFTVSNNQGAVSELVSEQGAYTLQTISLADKKTREIRDVRSVIPTDASFSPDGRWIVYQSREGFGTGNVNQSFVQPFPPTGARYLVPQPGAHPYWSAKGDRLILNTGANRSMTLGIITSPQISFSPPVALPRNGRTETNPSNTRRAADSLPDGRILGIALAGQTTIPGAPPEQIVVVLNWFDELRARVPVK
jgi:serine/threonine protein kinase/Tol biopolymer transport system component